MRVLPLATIVAVSILAAGCSKSSDSGSASAAAASPAASIGPAVKDKRTGLPIYPGALQTSTSDSNGNRMTSFSTNDPEASVVAYYKAALTDFTLGDSSSNGTMEFDKKSGDATTASVSLSTSGSQVYIDLETFK